MRATYNFHLAGIPSDAVVVVLSSDPQYCTIMQPRSFVFYPEDWSEPRNVTIFATDNPFDDGWEVRTAINHTVHSDAFGYRDLDSPVQVEVSLRDDDLAFINATTSLLEISEGGELTLSVRLNSRPRAPVQLNLSAVYTEESLWYELDPAVVNAQATAIDAICAAQQEPEACASVTYCSWFVTECQASDETTAIINAPGTRPSANAQLLFTPTQITIMPSDWQDTVNITCSAIDDSLAELQQMLQVVVSSTSSDPRYNPAPSTRLVVELHGNDDVEIVNSGSAGVNFTESETAEYSYALTHQPANGAVFVQMHADTGLVSVTRGVLLSGAEWDIQHLVRIQQTAANMHRDNGDSYTELIIHQVLAGAIL
eukprot:SAG11_NODE_202_length_12550_cov_5.549835_8_plen_368_part_01